MTSFPDFLVIGAARAGTTALHGYLGQHPQLFLPAVKEPNFFAFDGETLDCRGPGADYINNSITDWRAYRALFSAAPDGTIKGEASPLYLYAEKAPARIAARAPDCKLIAILRNPIEQAFSHYLYATKQAIEPLADFTAALAAEDDRMAAGWQPLFGYSRFPAYATQLQRYFDHFARGQMLIATYEDWQQDPAGMMRRIFAFIGADPGFVPDMRHRPNAGGVPKNRAIQDFLMKPNPVTGAVGLVIPKALRWKIRDRLAALNLRHEARMPDAARNILRDRLADEINRLGPMIGRDLSHWLD